MTCDGKNHPVCEYCWILRTGDREPVRLVERELDLCCFCGAKTDDGIYVRAMSCPKAVVMGKLVKS